MCRPPPFVPVALALLAGMGMVACRANLPAVPPTAVAAAGTVANPMGVYDPRWTTLPDQAPQDVPARVAVREAVAPTWSGSVGVGLFSHYVWRGALLTDDPVLQPDVTVAYGGLSLGVWGNLDLTNVNGFGGELNEVDVTLDYTHRFEGRVPVEASIGAIWYTSPSGWFDDLGEIYGGVGLDTFLQPRLTVYVGVYEVEGVFGTLEIGHDAPLGCGTLELGAGISAGDGVFHESLLGARTEAFGELFLDVGWTYTRGRWSIRPGLRFSTLLDDTLRDAQADNDLVVLSLQTSLHF